MIIRVAALPVTNIHTEHTNRTLDLKAYKKNIKFQTQTKGALPSTSIDCNEYQKR